ncbi:hypothetical protein ACROYT_G006607 [Oculina patagonica]
MGFKAALLLIFWLSKSTLGAINETYSETHCKLVTDGNDVSTEFRTKSSEHGVRMVYLHLNVGNESYNPLQSYDRFLPSRWTWARGVDEPMLSFSYQYQVLSLGLLRNQVRSTKVALSDEPRGCLANLTSTSKDIVVARTLLEKVIDDHDSNSPLPSEDVVCVSVVQRSMDKLTALYYGNVEYRCCRKQKRGNRTVVQCDLPAKEDIWLSLFYHELTIGVIIAFFSWPATIVFFGEEYNFSPLISAAAVFLSGKIADIFLQRESLQGWSKIRKKEEIREAVKEWRKSETTNREMKNEKADAVIDNNADTKELAV